MCWPMKNNALTNYIADNTTTEQTILYFLILLVDVCYKRKLYEEQLKSSSIL